MKRFALLAAVVAGLAVTNSADAGPWADWQATWIDAQGRLDVPTRALERLAAQQLMDIVACRDPINHPETGPEWRRAKIFQDHWGMWKRVPRSPF